MERKGLEKEEREWEEEKEKEKEVGEGERGGSKENWKLEAERDVERKSWEEENNCAQERIVNLEAIRLPPPALQGQANSPDCQRVWHRLRTRPKAGNQILAERPCWRPPGTPGH